jgi:hypothetical protein
MNHLPFISARRSEEKLPYRTVSCPLLFCVDTGMPLLILIVAETGVCVPLPSKLISSAAAIPAFSRCLSINYSVTISNNTEATLQNPHTAS